MTTDPSAARSTRSIDPRTCDGGRGATARARRSRSSAGGSSPYPRRTGPRPPRAATRAREVVQVLGEGLGEHAARARAAARRARAPRTPARPTATRRACHRLSTCGSATVSIAQCMMRADARDDARSRRPRWSRGTSRAATPRGARCATATPGCVSVARTSGALGRERHETLPVGGRGARHWPRRASSASGCAAAASSLAARTHAGIDERAAQTPRHAAQRQRRHGRRVDERHRLLASRQQGEERARRLVVVDHGGEHDARRGARAASANMRSSSSSTSLRSSMRASARRVGERLHEPLRRQQRPARTQVRPDALLQAATTTVSNSSPTVPDGVVTSTASSVRGRREQVLGHLGVEHLGEELGGRRVGAALGEALGGAEQGDDAVEEAVRLDRGHARAERLIAPGVGEPAAVPGDPEQILDRAAAASRIAARVVSEPGCGAAPGGTRAIGRSRSRPGSDSASTSSSPVGRSPPPASSSARRARRSRRRRERIEPAERPGQQLGRRAPR